MGMPGSKMALEELMSQVLGDLLKEGIAAKITNDLYWDGNSLGELLLNWKKVLQALHKCDLCLFASNHRPSVHNDSRQGLELLPSKCQPSPNLHSSLVPHCPLE